jgi:hypothetical protein
VETFFIVINSLKGLDEDVIILISEKKFQITTKEILLILEGGLVVVSVEDTLSTGGVFGKIVGHFETEGRRKGRKKKKKGETIYFATKKFDCFSFFLSFFWNGATSHPSSTITEANYLALSHGQSLVGVAGNLPVALLGSWRI